MAHPTIQQQAQQQLNPAISALTKAAMRRARLSEKAISGFTNSYANQLGQINAASPYQAAVGQQASVDSALQQSLAGAGTDLASQLAARLQALQGSSGAAAVDQTGGNLASRGNANANTELASGSSSLSQLLANQADAGSYSKKLPGLAKLSGLQGIKSAQQLAQQSIDQGTMQAEQQLPSIIHEIQAMNQNAHQFSVSAGQRQEQLSLEQRRLDIEAQHYQQEYGLSVARMQLAAQKAQQARQGLTPSELNTVSSHAQDFIKGMYQGVPGHVTYPNSSNGLTAPRIDSWKQAPVKYQKAIKMLIQRYPALGPERAIKIANSFYQPGEGGRPYGKNHVPPGFYDNGPVGVQGPRGGAYEKDPFGAGIEPAAYHTESAAARTIVSLAQKFKGTPYVWGGESPKGFDCSGFAQYLYGHAGISIPRTTYTQWTASNGHAVPKGQLLPGDLVFYKGSDSIRQGRRVLPGHVGIYMGHGKVMNAYGTGYGVRIDSVFSSALGGYMGARRFARR